MSSLSAENKKRFSSYKVDLGWKQLDQRRFTYITFSASFSLRLLTYPMSLLKTNRQTQQQQATSMIRKIYTTQGIKGLYKGISINLIGNTSHVLYATIYETTREIITNSMNNNNNNNNNDNNNDKFIEPFASGIAGIFASIIQLSIATPFDIIAQKRMILSGNDINIIKPKNIILEILNEEGSIFGLWRGLTLALMTYAPTSGIVWASYRYFKPKMHDLLLYNNDNYILLNFISGGISGGLAGLLTIPLDTIKVRKQVLEKRSTRGIDIVRNVYNESGIYGFFRGVIPRTCQYTISCAIIMTVYDWVKRMSVVI